MSSSPSPADRDTPDVGVSAELVRHVRAWRLRLDPRALPEFLPGWSGAQRRRWVSQEQIAQLVGCSTQWYSRLELGYLENYSEDFVRTVARVLRLSSDETRLLFLLAGKQPPTLPRRAAPGGLDQVWLAQRWATYLSDLAWDVVGYNEHMRWPFPWAQQDGANLMKWVFTDQEARHRLYRWETDWAPQMLAQLRVAHLRHPDNQRLRTVIGEILDASPEARRLWQQPLAYFHPDGDRRSICLPDQAEPCLVQIVALEPLRLPGNRLIMLVPERAQHSSCDR